MASKMTCKNSPKTFYTGKEMSPLGVGFCADAEKVGVKMTGKDNKEWVVGLKKGNKLWIRAKDEPKTPEPEEDSDAEDEDKPKDEDEDSESESDSEEEKPKPKEKAKPKAKAKKEDTDSESDEPKEKPKPKAKAKAKKEESDSDSDEPKPKPKSKSKAKAKSEFETDLEKLLEAHNIHGKAAETFKSLYETGKKFMKKNASDKPKRAPSTYNKFISVKLTEIRKEKPNLKAKEYMELAAKAWGELTPEEKKTWTPSE